jgi:hypothetical protein
LVGVVEECPAPYEDHRARCHADAGAILAEGSHWLLLDAAATPGAGSLDLKAGSAQALLEALVDGWSAGDTLAFGPLVPPTLMARAAQVLGVRAFGEDLPWHDSLAAARLGAWLVGAPGGRLHLLCGGPERFALLQALAPGMTPR